MLFFDKKRIHTHRSSNIRKEKTHIQPRNFLGKKINDFIHRIIIYIYIHKTNRSHQSVSVVVATSSISFLLSFLYKVQSELLILNDGLATKYVLCVYSLHGMENSIDVCGGHLEEISPSKTPTGLKQVSNQQNNTHLVLVMQDVR